MTDRLATQLLRVARDPHSGRLRNPGPLAIGLRAALFTDLALTGRIVNSGRGPSPGPVGDSGDRILDAVVRAVQRRPDVPWWRWYRHVGVDRSALCEELIAAERWVSRPGRMRGPAFDDRQADATLELAHFALSLLGSQAAPANTRAGMLALLAGLCGSVAGRPRPRALRRDLAPLVRATAATGEPGAEMVPAIVHGAAVLLRRPLRR